MAKLFGKLSTADQNQMELIANCHVGTEVNLMTLEFLKSREGKSEETKPERNLWEG